MKKTVILLISLLLVNYSNVRGSFSPTESNIPQNDSISVMSTPDLFNLTSRWASEYNKLHPEMKIKVISVSDTKIAEKLTAGKEIGFVSTEKFSGFENQTLWKAVIGRDVIVPVINSKNPFSDEISRQGISAESLAALLAETNSQKWGSLLKNSQKAFVNYYWINDASLKTGIAEFLKVNEVGANGIELKDGQEMISAIQKDPYAIGFCKMVNLIDFKSQGIAENIRLLPIDRNGNGLIDYSENIYDDLNSFTRGVWIGKYPKALSSNIYSVSSDQPKNENEVAFLKWILTDGQQFLVSNGYSDLLASERQTTVDKLNYSGSYTTATTENNSLPKIFLLIIAGLVVAGLITDSFIRYIRKNKTLVHTVHADYNQVLDENSLIVPKGLYFDKTHTWAFLEENGVVKVGVDDFLQHITGPVTRVKMESKGKTVKKGDKILSIIQNGKQLNLYAPVSGTIIDQNKNLNSDTSLINSSPYSDGWVYKIDPINWHRENQLLFMAEKQREFLKNEFSRLKDFFAIALNGDSEKYAQVVLQDGGELRDGTLADLGPEVWEEFQTKFIDPSRQLWFYEMF